MKSNVFFTLMRKLLSAVLLVSSTLLFTGCPSVGSLCPDRTCSDLALLATAVDNGATADYKLTFQDIGLNDTYNVEAVDSATNQVLYSSIGTTSRVHTFSQPFSWRTVKWTVTAMYCTEPQKTVTCTTYSKIDGGGIGVVITDRSAVGNSLCSSLLSLKDFKNTYVVANPSTLSNAAVGFYDNINAIATEAQIMTQIAQIQTSTGRNVRFEVLSTNADVACSATIAQTNSTPLLLPIQSLRRINNRADLHVVIDSVFRQTPKISTNGYPTATNQYLRFIRYR